MKELKLNNGDGENKIVNNGDNILSVTLGFQV